MLRSPHRKSIHRSRDQSLYLPEQHDCPVRCPPLAPMQAHNASVSSTVSRIHTAAKKKKSYHQRKACCSSDMALCASRGVGPCLAYMVHQLFERPASSKNLFCSIAPQAFVRN
ncbi:hypothetical protein BGW36DRAFT_390042 [Talaromyces proteolyticus]|uniref:Uncharacterized protein n=1 Tax=Talaromyces proteolyticus TaxID=1131652 RepID=A0AAD4KGQ2_9EURO|nr:uncharacterized protein BGW36DRAFT_390042 [Talaromyces proteolyticus]KAH8689992.1 hypothetical protein BGW36DRAFT_390042 [Talaromyces proteolyticus]